KRNQQGGPSSGPVSPQQPIFIPEDIDQGHAPGAMELVPPPIQPIDLSEEEFYDTPRGPINAPPLPPPGTIGSQPASSRVPPEGGTHRCCTNRPSVAAESYSVQPERTADQSRTRQRG
ncbi:MAG: hypothetical protein ACKPKO_52120, partial [Candidatus Fonsibacter sp.]